MKLSRKLQLAALVLFACPASDVLAAPPQSRTRRQEKSVAVDKAVRPTSHADRAEGSVAASDLYWESLQDGQPTLADSGDAAATEGTAPAAENAPTVQHAAESDTFMVEPEYGSDSMGGIDYGGCCACCPDVWGDPWALFGNSALEDNGITVRGWFQGGYTFNPDRPASRGNYPFKFNDFANRFQMNQLYAYMEALPQNNGNGFGLGGRVDLLYGTDHFYTQALGLETELDGSQKWNRDVDFGIGSPREFAGAAEYGLAMPQAYASLAINDLTLKVGHFYSIVGYESIMSVNNFFYSHTYAQMFGGPFTHTGVLGSFEATDNATFFGGVTRGWDNFEDLDENLAAIGGVSVRNTTGSSLAFAFHAGNEQGLTQNAMQYIQSLTFTTPVSDATTWVLLGTYGFQDDRVLDLTDFSTSTAHWYGVAQYVVQRFSKTWSGGFRMEWFRDEDTTRVFPGGVRPLTDDGNYYEASLGLNYQPSANIIFRPEVRWDWGGESFPLIPDLAGVYDDFSDRNMFTIGGDCIVRF